MLRSVLASRCVQRMAAPVILRLYSAGAADPMDKFLGKWKMNPKKWTGFEQFADAMKVNEEMRTALRARTNTTIEFKRGDSDNYISITDHGDKQQIITFKLGVPFTFDEEGFEVKSIMQMDNGNLVGQHELGPVKFTNKAYIQNQDLVNEDSCNGATQTMVFERMD